MTPLIEFKHITKRFPGIIANDDISFGIEKGEILAILGENGAGKSTLMSMLFGMYQPDDGEILINGTHQTISSPVVANELSIGMVHQHFMLVEDQTIAENIILGIEPTKKKFGLLPYVDLEYANTQIKEISQLYQLEVNPTDLIKNIPVSTRQRVEILKMLYRNAEILIFDEPTAVLTPQEIESLLQIIQNLRAKGKTIILITHKLDEVKKIADRCAIICKGKLVGLRDIKTTSIKEMSALMVGREILFNIAHQEHEIGELVLEVKNLTVVSHDNITLVNNASFNVHRGEILAIAGVAGNGQVEIADAITGLIRIKGGSILLSGIELTDKSIRERSRLGISYIPEDRHLVGLILDLSLRENLLFKQYYMQPYCNNHGILDFNQMNILSDCLIKDYDIRCSNGNKTVTRSMSGGNQQKAIIAREINLSSNLFIFVQPTRGLDVGAIESIHQRIDELRASGKAILLISLELDEIMELSDTILVMYNGKVQTIKKSSELTKFEVGEYMMGAHVEKN